jgi:excisionase family DNA binding protein
MKRYLRIAEVAETLDVNPRTARAWIESGELPAFHVARTVRVSSDDLDQFIARNQKTASVA